MRGLASLVASVLIGSPLAAQSQVIQPAQAEKTVESRTFQVAPGTRLKVRNVNGGLKITAWDKNEVAFMGTFRPSSRDEQVKVVVEQDGKSLSLKAEQPKEGWFKTRSASCEMELRVPYHMSLALHTVNGGIEAEEVEGDHTLETVNGALKVKGLKGALEMETVNGGLKGEGLGGITRGLKASTVNGGIVLALGPIQGQLKASTVNGGITFNAKGAEGVEIKRNRVTATFPGSTQELRISTVNGGITLQ